jgi:hypothetical protein
MHLPSNRSHLVDTFKRAPNRHRLDESDSDLNSVNGEGHYLGFVGSGAGRDHRASEPDYAVAFTF